VGIMRVKLDATDLMATLKNTVQYSDSFLKQLKASEPKLTQKIADTSIVAFYEYMDGIARSHPGMFHHVYEWGQVGDPFGRLFELNRVLARNSARIDADFLASQSTSPNGTEPFYDKAQIMEEGSPVIVKEKDASVLFFEIEGEEFFRHGPIYIANPGGSATRGSFLNAYNEFYQFYFTNFYLKTIRFYEHFDTPQEFIRNFKSAVKSKTGAAAAGRKMALSWIESAPGDVA
jgi:hypothetical protein